MIITIVTLTLSQRRRSSHTTVVSKSGCVKEEPPSPSHNCYARVDGPASLPRRMRLRSGSSASARCGLARLSRPRTLLPLEGLLRRCGSQGGHAYKVTVRYETSRVLKMFVAKQTKYCPFYVNCPNFSEFRRV